MSINLHKALEYPLAVATVDGTRRKTPRSKIMEIILNSLDYDDNTNNVPSNAIYVIDLIAYLHSLVKLPATFRLLARWIISDIPCLCVTRWFTLQATHTVKIASNKEQLAGGQAEEYIL